MPIKISAIRVAYFLLLGCMIFVLSCTNSQWEINTKIKPKILALTSDSVSIEYRLGPLLILDDLTNLEPSQVIYMSKMKEFELGLFVSYRDGTDNASDYERFTYMLGVTVLARTRPVVFEILERNSDKIDGFEWKVKDGVTFKEKTLNPKNEDNML